MLMFTSWQDSLEVCTLTLELYSWDGIWTQARKPPWCFACMVEASACVPSIETKGPVCLPAQSVGGRENPMASFGKNRQVIAGILNKIQISSLNNCWESNGKAPSITLTNRLLPQHWHRQQYGTLMVISIEVQCYVWSSSAIPQCEDDVCQGEKSWVRLKMAEWSHLCSTCFSIDEEPDPLRSVRISERLLSTFFSPPSFHNFLGKRILFKTTTWSLVHDETPLRSVASQPAVPNL